jgi:hypothetical protein
MENIGFATVINCMDGRTQEPLIKWIKNKFNIQFVDTITEPGPDKILAEGPEHLINSIRSRLLISFNKHGSKNVVLVSHYDCAGNPVSKDKHLSHLKKAIDLICSWDLNVNVIGVWVDENWQVNEITL